MAARLHVRGFRYAQRLIQRGQMVIDGRDDWSKHRPSAEAENRFIEQYGWVRYGNWHLGIDPDEPEQAKARYKFPYGDFERVHRCGVLSAEVRAGQYKYTDIEVAAVHLHGLLDALGKPKAY